MYLKLKQLRQLQSDEINKKEYPKVKPCTYPHVSVKIFVFFSKFHTCKILEHFIVKLSVNVLR